MGLFRDVRAGDTIEISGPCTIRVRRKRGRTRLFFEAAANVKIKHIAAASLDSRRKK